MVRDGTSNSLRAKIALAIYQEKGGAKRSEDFAVAGALRLNTLSFDLKIDDYVSAKPIDFDRLRNEVVTTHSYVPSFGKHEKLQQQLIMLEHEFSGQLRLKLVHAILNVFLRRNIEAENVYRHFCTLWAGHGDILIETLDSRWLIAACDTICDYSADPDEASSAIMCSLFGNTLKLAETERLITSRDKVDPVRIKGRIPLFDGMTAFMSGGGDMPANLLNRLDRALKPDTLTGMIGRELISRALSGDTVFTRLAKLQTKNLWRSYLLPVPAPGPVTTPAPKVVAVESRRPGYILLNDTGRLGDSFHIGTVYACNTIRQSLARRGLHEIGWANDGARFDALLAGATHQPVLVLLNGEGTLHHGAPRAAELLSMCGRAKDRGIGVAVINTVWEGNPEAMIEALKRADIVHVRDSLSRKSLPADFPAAVTPDVSIQLFLQTMRDGRFLPPQHEIGVIDSVVPQTSAALLCFAEQNDLPFFAMPVGNLRNTRHAVAARSGPVWPRLLQMTDLMTAKAWVTGRFHGLIAALCAGHPVCALRSNTAKVEGFLHDAGLVEACLLSPNWSIAPVEQKRSELTWRFEMQQTATFIHLRETYLETADERITLMFDAVASLTR